MPNNDILSDFNSVDINGFKKDFFKMIKVGVEIDREYGRAQHDLDILLPKFERCVSQFNKKYKDIKIMIEKSVEHFKLRLLVNEKNIKDFFSNSASKISGIKSVGKFNFNEIDVNDGEKFAKFLDLNLNKIYISYLEPESGMGTIIASYNKNYNKVELTYNTQGILNDNSAGFKACAFYALRKGYDKRINIFGEMATFGFLNLLNEIEKREWYDRFNPRFLE
ncbi:hypothetical protein HYW99_03805 [Candidatus Woesearchaeota archaeon]|nr:hypothetical protein [Candidatus Woesearchaeota archaeon]